MNLNGATIGGVDSNGNSLGNIASIAYNGWGGGIWNKGTLNLISGSIDHNKAFTDGGGIYKVAGTVSGNRLLVHDNTLISGTSDNISP